MSGLYSSARQAFLDGDLSWSRDPVRAALVRTGGKFYRANLKTHRNFSDVPEAAVVAVSEPLEKKTSEDGVADAEPALFGRVVGESVEVVVLFIDAGERLLIAFLDDVGRLPMIPTGGAVILSWSKGPNKIFKL